MMGQQMSKNFLFPMYTKEICIKVVGHFTHITFSLIELCCNWIILNWYIPDGSDLLDASFRGYPLQGKKIDIPSGYRGLVLNETKKPLTDVEERKLQSVKNFSKLTYWNWDDNPTSGNSSIHQLLDWMLLSKTVNIKFWWSLDLLIKIPIFIYCLSNRFMEKTRNAMIVSFVLSKSQLKLGNFQYMSDRQGNPGSSYYRFHR